MLVLRVYDCPTGLISAMSCTLQTSGGQLAGSHSAHTDDWLINDRQRQTQKWKEGGRPTVWHQSWDTASSLSTSPACGSTKVNASDKK